MPYQAPKLDFTGINSRRVICGNSTSEAFQASQDYSGDWMEED